MRLRNGWKLGLLLASLLLAGPASQSSAGIVTYGISIDTAGFNGQEGYLDLQLGTAGAGVPIQALIGDFSTDATLSGTTDDFSGGTAFISGSLPGALTLNNDDSMAQIAYGSQYFSVFGNTLSFSVTFDSDSIGAPSSSTPSFSIALFGGSPDYSPFFAGPDGQNNAAVFFQINPDGSVTTESYAGANGNAGGPAPIVSIRSVPEPGTITIFASGLICVIAGSWRARRRAVGVR